MRWFLPWTLAAVTAAAAGGALATVSPVCRGLTRGPRSLSPARSATWVGRSRGAGSVGASGCPHRGQGEAQGEEGGLWGQLILVWGGRGSRRRVRSKQVVHDLFSHLKLSRKGHLLERGVGCRGSSPSSAQAGCVTLGQSLLPEQC